MPAATRERSTRHLDTRLPRTEELELALAPMLRNLNGTARFCIVQRRLNPWSSTYTSEILTCQSEDGRVDILCKYDRPIRSLAWEHRHGLAYEACVYQNVLATSAATVPRFYGYHEGGRNRPACLALEFCGTAMKLQRAPDSSALENAAQWLGRFHAEQESGPDELHATRLRYFDETFYVKWADRLQESAHKLTSPPVWLDGICERFRECAGELTASRSTIIHGEFYPSNVLFDPEHERVLPIDWESAGIGAGEVDLAALTENWPVSLRIECERRYLRERWDAGFAGSFAQRMDLARMYLAFRWLCDSLAGTDAQRQERCLQKTARIASELEWIE